MITYMCDVKSSLRQERVKVDQLKKDSDLVQKEKEALEEEKARLLREIEERNKEKEAALKLEGELRDHCSRAHEAYTSMIECVSFSFYPLLQTLIFYSSQVSDSVIEPDLDTHSCNPVQLCGQGMGEAQRGGQVAEDGSLF
jgi:hypothetical protein